MALCHDLGPMTPRRHGFRLWNSPAAHAHGRTMASSPLRRMSDRVEEVGRNTFIVLALLGIPLAVAIAISSHAEAAGEAQRVAMSSHSAEAVTLEDAAMPVAAPPIAGTYVTAQWTAPDGTTRKGTLEVPAGTPAGDHVSVWLTDTGKLTDPPPKRSQLFVDAVFVALAIMLLAGGAAYVSFRVLRFGLDRWRLHEWDRDWERFEIRQRRQS